MKKKSDLKLCIGSSVITLKPGNNKSIDDWEDTANCISTTTLISQIIGYCPDTDTVHIF